MKRSWFAIGCLVLLGSGNLWGIPNSVFGPVAQAESPLNGEDLTDRLLAAVADDGELPGIWVAEGKVGTAEISHLLARPVLFGQEVVMLRAVRRAGELERVEATFADAGSYFGFFDEELPIELSKRKAQQFVEQRMAAKQSEFAQLYSGVLDGLREGVAAVADREQPKTVKFGKGRRLRAEVEEWRKGELSLYLFAADQRLVRLVIWAKDRVAKGWVDADFVNEDERQRAARLASSVRKERGGGVRIEGIVPLPQGYRPYCGLNTLAMAARHFGLHLDEDWMAAAAGFQNTGSAGGSNMVRLYHAVAQEAGLSLDRRSKFDEAAVKRALSMGLPVIVWRRFSWQRNRLHDEVAAGRRELPASSGLEEKSAWPDGDAPLHASILTGYDEAKGEVFFLESWTGQDQPRRMSFAEMQATSYLCFVFGL